MNLLSTFLATAGRRAEATAVVAGDGTRISYAALARRSATLAGRWRREGIGPGDRVLLAMPVGIELYAAIAALWRIGATIVFPEPAMGLAGLRHAVRTTSPRAVLTSGWYGALPLAVPALWRVPIGLHPATGGSPWDGLEEVGPDHPALISFTSGSTGAPKGIVRSHGFLAAQNACVAQMLAPERDDEVDLVGFPVFVIANLGLGVTSVLPDWRLTRHDRADPAAVARLVAGRGVGRALVPPSICARLAAAGIDPGLRAVFTGGGPVFPDLMRDLRRVMPGTSVTTVYGSTEAEPIAHQRVEDILPAAWTAMARGAGLIAGRPIPQIRLKIVDDEIVVTGEHVNKSYLDGRGDGDTKLLIDGEIWHRTGDAGRLDADGTLWLRGRRSAKAGSLFPFEVEVAARTWPGVTAVALIPGSDPPRLAIAGQEPAAGLWRGRAAELGDIEISAVAEIPLDRRHRSKVDYARLRL